MIDIVGPCKSEFLEDKLKYLEMIVLFVTYYIDMLVEVILGETALGCSEVLSHIH